MVSKRFIVVASATILALSVFLAYLFWEESKDPKVDYSWLVSEMRQNQDARERGLYGFIRVEPERIHHIGDPIVVRFGAIYIPSRWEVDEGMFHELIPLSIKFEVRERHVRITKREDLVIIEAVLLVQCLVCREGAENVTFPIGEFLAKDKVKGGALAILASSSSREDMQFASLTDSAYAVDDTLVRMPINDDRRIRFPFLALAVVCLLVAAGLFVYRVSLMHSRDPEAIDEDIDTDLMLSRVQKLRRVFQEQGADRGDTAHSLYRLLLSYRREHEDAHEKVGEILVDLDKVYDRDGISRESLVELLAQAEALIAQGALPRACRGEV